MKGQVGTCRCGERLAGVDGRGGGVCLLALCVSLTGRISIVIMVLLSDPIDGFPDLSMVVKEDLLRSKVRVGARRGR